MRTLTRPRMQIGWKTWLGIGLAGPLVAGVAMMPSNASDVDDPPSTTRPSTTATTTTRR